MTDMLRLLLDFAAEHPVKSTLWLMLVSTAVACGPFRLVSIRHYHDAPESDEE